jgi:hypothetical protein
MQHEWRPRKQCVNSITGHHTSDDQHSAKVHTWRHEWLTTREQIHIHTQSGGVRAVRSHIPTECRSPIKLSNSIHSVGKQSTTVWQTSRVNITVTALCVDVRTQSQHPFSRSMRTIKKRAGLGRHSHLTVQTTHRVNCFFANVTKSCILGRKSDTQVSAHHL